MLSLPTIHVSPASRGRWRPFASTSACVAAIAFALFGRSARADEPFTFATLEARAEALAAAPYAAPAQVMPASLQALNYDTYRAIRFRPDHALWAAPDDLAFNVQFFHCGFYFKEPVHVFTLAGDRATEVAFSTDLFDYGGGAPPADLPADLGFAGFRVHFPLNGPDYRDELVAFLGASYFRVLGKGQIYGLSARGLALDCGDDRGEEFPRFSQFFVAKPARDANELRVLALLESASVTGAYEFTFVPGASTRASIRATLFARVDLHKPGLAPLTSMFLFGENRVRYLPDFRPEVHDSDGLSIEQNDGTWVWRPLDNPPQRHRITRVAADGVKQFALLQRDRDFDHYQDLETHAERRPSYVIVPRAGFEHGHVELVEIPTTLETNDNTVAYFVPAAVAKRGERMAFAYDLLATTDDAAANATAIVAATRIDPDIAPDEALFVLDFAGRDNFFASTNLRADVTACGHEVRSIVMQRASAERVRVSFRVARGAAEPIELRARLVDGDEAISETWTYLADLP